MKKLGILALVALLSLASLAACGSKALEEPAEPFPYEDLSEDAYIANAQAYWEAISSYLDQTDAATLSLALEGFQESRGEVPPENYGAMDMIMAYTQYLREANGLDSQAIEGMTDAEKTQYYDQANALIETTLPNAVKVQNETTKKKEAGQGLVGRMTYKDQKTVSVYEDGTVLVAG